MKVYSLIIVILLLVTSYLLPSQTISAATPTSPPKQSTSEKAVDLFNNSLLVKEIVPNPPNDSIFDVLKRFVTNLLNPKKFYEQSELLHNSYLPKEIKSSDDNPNTESKKVLGIKEDIENRFKGFLGGSTGFYGVSLPDFSNEVKEAQSIGEYEKLYEQAHFPPRINPVTK